MMDAAPATFPTVQLIFDYFPELDASRKKQFTALKDLYADWNSKINVISRKDFDFFYERHVLHSLAIAKFIQFKKGTTILDVGTGGGFPGIPLAIMFPDCDFLLVDSIGKKIKVVNEVATALGLKNVRGIHSRVEDIREEFDFIVSRAVTAFPEFYKWVNKKISPVQKNKTANGILYLKGGDLKEEFKGFEKQTKFISLTDYFKEDFFETKKLVYVK